MTSKTLRTVAAAAIATFAAAPLGALAETKVTMHLDWLINGYHAPFHVAKEKGWYAEGGLDVTVNPGKGSFDAVRAVGSGDAEFGFPDAATAVKSIAEGIPLTMVAVFLQETPMGIISYADKNITQPKDLEGKSLSSVPIASTAKVLPAFFKKNGVDGDKVTLVNHTFATAVPSVLADQVDAGTGYVFGEYLAIRNAAGDRAVNWISFADSGIQLYSNGIAVNNDFLAANPDAVAAFVQASVRGLEWTIANVDAAIDILSKHTETEKATLKEQLEAAIPLMNNADAMRNGLGTMTAQKWATTQDIMIEYGGQPSRVPDESAYATRFLP